LIRDAAYEALLKSRRKELHRLVARTIDEKFSAFKDAHPEVLARHWSAAGESEPAIAEWSRAAKTAEMHNAFREAQESYQQALALLNTLMESPERDLHELELRQSAHMVLVMTRGWAAPETVNATERITILADKTGNLTKLSYSLLFRGFSAWIAGNLATAGALTDQALLLAKREGTPATLGLAHGLQVAVRYWRGDLAGAEEHFITGLKFFDDPVFRQIPMGSTAGAFGYGSFVAWTLGRADVARERLAHIMAAVDRNNPADLAASAIYTAWLCVFMRKYDQADAAAVQVVELSEKHQFPNFADGARCLLGMARAQLGRSTEGIALLRQGIAGMLQHGARLSIAVAWLAEAQEHAGFLTEAFETVEQGLGDDLEESVFRPEMLRIRGELRLKDGRSEPAEADFQNAITLARGMGAKMWELRATISLARLLAEHGRCDEARMTLAAIYNWFTEGFDTADLKEARALLDELTT
jgi:tetratricopeptide (TPR) repeat protein